MNYFRAVFLFGLSLILLSGDFREADRMVKGANFFPGEVIEYKVHYGFVNAAEAQMMIHDRIETVNGRGCYKIDVFGKSIGMFDLFLRIRDNWGTYMDTAALIPRRSYRKIEEGKYRKHEVVDFDHGNGKAVVRNYNHKKSEWKPSEEFEMPPYAQGMVSGYYYLRTLDFQRMKVGEIIDIKAFFDDETYDFKIRYLGRERVRTKLGKKNALVLSPIMPENGLFDGENSIKVWLSDDAGKVPVKIKAQMFVGAVEIDIQSYTKGRAW